MENMRKAPQREAISLDLKAAVIAGLVAGGVALAFDLLWTVFVLDSQPWHTAHLVAALLMGSDLLLSAAQEFSLEVLVLALAIHVAASLLFGILIASIIAGLHAESSRWLVVAIGAGCGALLYFVNFYGMDGFFPWIVDLRAGSRGVEHVVFGIFAALEYRTHARPVASLTPSKAAIMRGQDQGT